ncbi:hypothetical protein [Pseudoalteromonas byunsanensis]|uniref:Uncharacterized protein n=1 Tax=Pseudoalteromonas byunsanensis TaxID=327939 RepID=A0A1S1ND48_9GAMM|nr:hypothetical protein [Pseudoalteromonas byunsanensis]OHU97600.1 hypothetical protein BIW53_01515 [Pseudoalteromonas byunsanensis]
MKKLTTALAFMLSFGAQAIEPIYVGGEQYSYTMSDFTPVYANGHIVGYDAAIPVGVDMYDDFIGDYPELIFDVSGEAVGTTDGSPMLMDMSVVCSGVDIGYDADVVINRRGRLIPARFSIYNRTKTNGECQELKLRINKTGSSATNPAATIDALNVNLIVFLNLSF